VLNGFLVWAIAVLSFNLLFGYSGYLSFGHALFFGGGAYVVTLGMKNYGLHYVEAVPIALVVVAIVAVVVGAISFRLTGLYFAIITLAFSMLFYELLFEFPDFTYGVDGITGVYPEPIAGLDLSLPPVAFLVLSLVLLGVFALCILIVYSPFGRVLQGIRENEERVEALGINTFWYKLRMFTISAVLAALAGSLYPLYISYISPHLMYWATSGDILIMSLIGGAFSLGGAIIGAAFYTIGKEVLLMFTERWRILFGIVFILFVLVLEEGLIVFYRWTKGLVFDREERSDVDTGTVQNELLDRWK
jgi:branched-chain amino acid transport system permease protein